MAINSFPASYARRPNPAACDTRLVDRLHRVVGPVATNVYVLADPSSREAIAIDTATPSLAWIAGALADRDWTLKLIVSTHGHWDHIGDNHAVSEATGADIAVHPADRTMLESPAPTFPPPFELVPSVAAVELAEGGEVRFGEIRLRVLHTPGHTPGSVCLLDADNGALYSGDTLFAGGWGRVDLPGGSAGEIAASLARLADLEDRVRVLPGHGASTTIGRERAWMDLVRREGRLPI
jgi:glyoxylase-like metal-dependent hydrolase (beta-lactamase superfamily II)